MTSMQQQVSDAEKILEDAVMTVMKKEDRCLNPGDITRLTGIFGEKGDPSNHEPNMNDAIVQGILVKLMKRKKVWRCDPHVRGSGYCLVKQ